MNNLLYILSLLLRVIPFLLVCLLSASINLDRRNRDRQFLMVILAVVFCIPCMIFTETLANEFTQLMNTIANGLRRLPLVGAVLSSIFLKLYRTLVTGYGVQLVCNTILMLFFCVIKSVALPILNRLWTHKTKLYQKTSGNFYVGSGGSAILKQKYGDMRRMFNALYVAAIVLGVADCMLVLLSNAGDVFLVPFYPVFGIIVLGEISFFINGKTPDEVGGTDEFPSSKAEPECGDILKALREIFADRLGHADQITVPHNKDRESTWEEELENGDSFSQVASTYFTSLKNDLHEINSDYVAATDKLMHHKSVLIYNPFYRDLTDYVLLPVFHELLNHHGCLVVCGRTTNEDDVVDWLKGGVEDVTNLQKLWKIRGLTAIQETEDLPDIGVLGFGRLFDLSTLQNNLAFLRKVSLIILLEPSNILGTGQIGLRSLLQLCETDREKPTFLILDRNVDGLVDALSHAIRQPLTEVVASPVAQSDYCRAFWRAEGPGTQTVVFPNISHYMGFGGEIAACAMHEGAQKVHWYSGSKMPLLDLRWNISQYYSLICQYIKAPREQVELDRRLQFHESLWQANYGPKSFVIVEDEFCNAFEMERAFGARIRDKGFINIMSESYMLRDYMYDNSDLFSADHKAIPSIVPDYVRTERNFVLRTLLLMSIRPLSENELRYELILHGANGKRPYREFVELVKKHTGIQNPKIQTLKEAVHIGVTNCARFSYSADRGFIEQVFNSALKSAFYIVEDEQAETYIMGNRLMDHIEQTILPGQFFSYDGKYYQVKSISRDKGIIVRRAADHLNRRCYYRQLKVYSLINKELSEETKTLRGTTLQKVCVDIEVETDAYLEMSIRNDLRFADYVKLENPRKRAIVHKNILVAMITDATPEVRYTICMLFNELFQTIYPNESDYIFATMASVPADILENSEYQTRIRSLIPGCNAAGFDEGAIYFIEDSNIDLGLLVSVERNFQRLMEIIADYLDWYLSPNRPRIDDCNTNKDRAVNSLEDEMEKSAHVQHDAELSKEVGMTACSKDATEDIDTDALDEDNSADDVDGEDEELLGKRCDASGFRRFEYLSFGDEAEASQWFALKETLEYLVLNRYTDSNLHRSRCKTAGFDEGSDYDPTLPGVHYCDFCGVAMEPDTYEVLKDGRERCAECGESAIKTRKQFKAVYHETVEEMKSVFGIEFKSQIKVRMSNAKKVNEGLSEYKPSPQQDPRVLGYAQGRTIVVENGAPRWKMKSTLVHELTHIWQHFNWDSNYCSKYSRDESVATVMEGMAVWAEVQYLLALGEKKRAIRYKRARDGDPSVYGTGMKKFLKKYPPLEEKNVPIKKSPFGHFPPL